VSDIEARVRCSKGMRHAVEKFYLTFDAGAGRLEVCGALLETFGGLFQKAALAPLRK
jgi:hypothetical protein